MIIVCFEKEVSNIGSQIGQYSLIFRVEYGSQKDFTLG